jgi:hypothetical protein
VKIKGYPEVLPERETLEAILSGRSIARYGDGELRVALGRKCVSQEADPKLAGELRAILADEQNGLLVGIPNIASKTPKAESWSRFCAPGYTTMYKQTSYASSFITRPDSAPWIDTNDYWSRVHDLWLGKDVILIAGDRKSLRADDIRKEAASVREVRAPRQHAYAEIDRIEEEINGHNGPILMCLGCTATALAARLHRKGLWGIDLGHIGMFMRHAGIYNIDMDTLCSTKYRQELRTLHEQTEWGQRGDRHAGDAFALVSRIHEMKGTDTELAKVTVLDYGCGEGSFKKALAPHRVQEYDPGIRGKDILPKPCDLVVCTDVMEHVEPKALMRVIDHIFRLTGYIAYIVVATRPANAVLPGGRNAHLIIENAEWWTKAFTRPGWTIESSVNRKDKDVTLTILKDRA